MSITFGEISLVLFSSVPYQETQANFILMFSSAPLSLATQDTAMKKTLLPRYPTPHKGMWIICCQSSRNKWEEMTQQFGRRGNLSSRISPLIISLSPAHKVWAWGKRNLVGEEEKTSLILAVEISPAGGNGGTRFNTMRIFCANLRSFLT